MAEKLRYTFSCGEDKHDWHEMKLSGVPVTLAIDGQIIASSEHPEKMWRCSKCLLITDVDPNDKQTQARMA